MIVANTTDNCLVKTVMIVSHADDYKGGTPIALRYVNDTSFSLFGWNYCFQPMKEWGQYFDLKDGWTKKKFKAYLDLFQQRGLRNLLSVDVTECDQNCSWRWADSVLVAGPEGGLDLMALNPKGSWYRYLRDGMVGITYRFNSSMRGFAIDRLDRSAAQLLDEVRVLSAVPHLVYAMNSLKDAEHQVSLLRVLSSSAATVCLSLN